MAIFFTWVCSPQIKCSNPNKKQRESGAIFHCECRSIPTCPWRENGATVQILPKEMDEYFIITLNEEALMYKY